LQQVLAATALTEEKHFVAAGEAYFITDPSPSNSTAFMQPLLEGLGYSLPSRRLPYWLMLWLAYWSEWAYVLLPKRLGFEPLFTRNEIRKAAVTHYFSCDKAKNQLGYQPEQRSVADEYLPWFIERGYGAKGKGKQGEVGLTAAPGKQQQQQKQPRAAAAAATSRRNKSSKA
jgi:nucleoside-diphosphate-sugar epimerase